MKTFRLLLISVILSACSLDVSDAPTLPAVTVTSPTAPTPQATIASPVPTSPAWAGQGLNGQAYFLSFRRGGQELVRLDLATGEMTTVFQPEDKGWLTAAEASPDGERLVLAYAPPPAEGELQFGYTNLYSASIDAPAELAPILLRGSEQEAFFNPIWSPDGAYLYFAHAQATDDQTGNPFQYDIERMAYPDGEPEIIVQDAFWPRLSSDGSRLVYITFDTADYSNDLYVANADGSDPILLVPSEDFLAVDAPLFSPDNAHIIFSAVSNEPPVAPASLSWFEQLLGVQTASAHNVPSDWWRVSIEGDKAERLTQIFDTGMYGDLSPDGERMIFVTTTGLFVMNPDGTGLQRLMDVWAGGTIDWVP
jgi:Tol biopolymer transport system component